MTSEIEVQTDTRIALSNGDTRLFRQQTGHFWQGEVTRLRDGSILLKNPRMVVSGFEGWPDLGGWVSVVVTPEMVGMKIAVAAQVEMKRPRGGKKGTQQKAFIAMACAMGVRAGFARSVDEAKKILAGG